MRKIAVFKNGFRQINPNEVFIIEDNYINGLIVRLIKRKLKPLLFITNFKESELRIFFNNKRP